MPESADRLVPMQELRERGLAEPVSAVLEEVVDVGRRLNHNVLGVEHLLVVGAENGNEAMARIVPGLAALREALLDLLFEDRDAFRYEPGGESDDEDMYLQPGLVALLEQMETDHAGGEVLAEAMESDNPRIRRAVEFARGNEPDVLPPDTMLLEQVLRSSEGAEGTRTQPAPAPAPASSPPSGRPAASPELPLTLDLGADAADDPPLVGRETLLDQVARILLRFHLPAVLLAGQPGAGKTAFVRGLARGAASGAIPSLAGYTFYQLKLLDLVAQSHRGQDIHNLVDQIVGVIASTEGAVLVVDDLHLLVAKQGYPVMSDLVDTVKMHVAKGAVRSLLTVDAGSYERSLAADPFFGSQISVKRLALLEREQLGQVAHLYQDRLSKHFGLSLAEEALEAAVAASLAESDPDYFPPGSTLRLLDEACAMARAEGASSVLADHVRRCIAEDASAVGHMDRRRLKDIESRLAERVLGQELAASAVGRRVRLAKLHLDRKPDRPDGVFLFMGPSGVGKTEMARALARALYDDESRLVRLDMSEYMEPHSVARIIGAPPGYVGYGENGALTGPVAELGHCVVLLDEIEKAHPRVLNLFLQVFDDGRLTDSKGRLVAFSDTVIIMTSNIGRELYAIHGSPPIGFGGTTETGRSDHPVRDAVQDHLLRVLPSEFVNRIDEVVPFRVLDEDDIDHISRRLLDMEVERWRERGKVMTYEDDVPSILASTGYDPRLGARHVERNIERLVISLISDAAVADGFDLVRRLELRAEDGIICLSLDGTPFQCLTDQGHPTGRAERPPDGRR